ncbi:MAG: enoyl-CoA hydratase-related protein [Alphaproteobacteria bacterium]
MSDDTILYAVEDGVATITFNRPDKLNAMTPQMLGDVFRRVRDASADPAVRVMVLTGAGRAFCAGLDLQVIGGGASSAGMPEAHELATPQWSDEIGPALERFYSHGWQDFITARKPIIAAINGPVFGWGFVLSLHCDIRFAARSALFNATFARLGIPAEKNAGWLLTRLVGPARAADLLYTARRFDGEEAERLGVVNGAIEDAALMDHVLQYAKGIATYSAPRSLAAIKAQIWTALDDPYNAAFQASDHEQHLATQTTDFREGFMSYTERRVPDFKSE